MLVVSIFSFSQSFLLFQKQISVFDSHLFCHLQMLSTWTGIKFCCLKLINRISLTYANLGRKGLVYLKYLCPVDTGRSPHLGTYTRRSVHLAAEILPSLTTESCASETSPTVFSLPTLHQIPVDRLIDCMVFNTIFNIT